MGCLIELRHPMYHPEFDDYEQELREFEEAVRDRYAWSVRTGGEADCEEELVRERRTLPNALYNRIHEWMHGLELEGEGHELALDAFEQADQHTVTYPPKGEVKKTRRIVWWRLMLDGRALGWLRSHRSELWALSGRDSRYISALLR